MWRAAAASIKREKFAISMVSCVQWVWSSIVAYLTFSIVHQVAIYCTISVARPKITSWQSWIAASPTWRPNSSGLAHRKSPASLLERGNGLMVINSRFFCFPPAMILASNIISRVNDFQNFCCCGFFNGEAEFITEMMRKSRHIRVIDFTVNNCSTATRTDEIADKFDWIFK